MKYTLDVDSVNKSFGEKRVLTDIYLKCEVGDIIGVFGKNGSGKSTLLKIIYGILNAENKFIRLNNRVVNKSYKSENGISYLPQDNFIPNNLIVKEVIGLTIIKGKLEAFFEDGLITPILNTKVGDLSGGELKYLQVKLILFSESKFCLLDEPYMGVSPILADKINEQILLQSKSKGIIVTDHNYLHVLKFASKIFLIKEGFGKFLACKEELVSKGYLNEGML